MYVDPGSGAVLACVRRSVRGGGVLQRSFGKFTAQPYKEHYNYYDLILVESLS